MFDKIVIKNRTTHENNIHLAVYPFPMTGPDWIRSFRYKGDPDTDLGRESLVDWQRKCVDQFFEILPGLQAVFLRNGEITLQHSGVFSDEEIVEAASKILRPVLEENLRLERLMAGG